MTLQKGCVTASAWRDNKVFVVMSTCCQPGMVQRRQRDGTQLTLPCPGAIICYNAYMGGVDRGDQMRGYYSWRSKSRKFYKYIFYFLLDTAVTNAYIMHTRYTESPTVKHMKDFRVALAKALIGDYCSRRRPGRGGPPLRSIPLRHFPVKVDGSSRSKRGRCAACTHKGKRVDSGVRNAGCGSAIQEILALTAFSCGTRTCTKSNTTTETFYIYTQYLITMLIDLHVLEVEEYLQAGVDVTKATCLWVVIYYISIILLCQIVSLL